MPEIKQISTQTRLTVSGSNIEIFTYYKEDELPNTILARISEEVGNQDMVPYVEGELLIQMSNYPGDIDFMLDGNGNLIVITNSGDANNYALNPLTGQLEYTS